MPRYLTVGAVDVDGRLITTRTLLTQMLAHNPAGVQLYAVKYYGRDQPVWNATEVSDERVFIVSGPDPYKKRLWTCQIKLVNGRIEIV